MPKGKYSVWIVLRETGDWTTVLDPNWRIFDVDPPDSNAIQIRVSTPISQAPLMEALTWSMPELTEAGGLLAMQWGTTRATLRVEVTPTLEVTMPEAEAQDLSAATSIVWRNRPRGAAPVRAFIVTYENRTLEARWEPNDDYVQTFALIRVLPDIFTPGSYDDHGTVSDVLRPDMTFPRVAGQPNTFTVRLDDDTLEAAGTRKP